MKALQKAGVLMLLITFLAACGGSEKPTTSEQKTIDTLVAGDQKAMDSLEQAILSQMNELDGDTTLSDSIEN